MFDLFVLFFTFYQTRKLASSIFPPYLCDGKLLLTSLSTIYGTCDMRFAPADLPSVYYMYQVFQMKLLTSAVAITKKPPSRTRDSSKTKRNDEVTATQRLKHVEISFKGKQDRYSMPQRCNSLSEISLPSLANEWLRRLLSCANRPPCFNNAQEAQKTEPYHQLSYRIQYSVYLPSKRPDQRCGCNGGEA